MKITIIYYSETGNTEKAVGFIKSGILRAGGFDARLKNIRNEEEIGVDFINESAAVIFGTPCYVANTCWQLKKFFDTRWDCRLEGKLAACYATANCMWEARTSR
jgi:NAD(P)H dehydrogenase (quinone)